MSLQIINYILLYIRTVLTSLLYNTILRDKSATRIKNSLLIPYYYNNSWNYILVPYSDYSKDQYTIAKYYDSNDQLIINYTVPKGMSLLVDNTDLLADRSDIIGEIEDE